MAPLQTLQINILTNYRSEIEEAQKYSSITMVFEALLNKKFGVTSTDPLQRIKIENAGVIVNNQDYIYNRSEGVQEVYIYNRWQSGTTYAQNDTIQYYTAAAGWRIYKSNVDNNTTDPTSASWTLQPDLPYYIFNRSEFIPDADFNVSVPSYLLSQYNTQNGLSLNISQFYTLIQAQVDKYKIAGVNNTINGIFAPY